MVKLKMIREEYGISQKELSEKLGVSRSGISMWEKSKANPSLKMAYKIAKFFHTNIEDLFTTDELR